MASTPLALPMVPLVQEKPTQCSETNKFMVLSISLLILVFWPFEIFSIVLRKMRTTNTTSSSLMSKFTIKWSEISLYQLLVIWTSEMTLKKVLLSQGLLNSRPSQPNKSWTYFWWATEDVQHKQPMPIKHPLEAMLSSKSTSIKLLKPKIPKFKLS